MSEVKLGDPTPQSEIKQRQGPGGRMLSYIDARFVMERLDAAVGSDNWQDRYEETANGIRCGIGIRVNNDFVWKWDAAEPSDIEPVKGAHSDAFKRAAVKWGIGRDLYGDHPTPPQTTKTATQPHRELRALVGNGLRPDDPPWPLDEIASVTVITDESTCPVHHKAWRTNSKGYYCASKVGDGWCQRKPSAAWAASQELVTAG